MNDALMLGSVNVNDGVTYWLADGYDPGVGPVELANVETLLDGDRLAGGRTGNREITLPVVVIGTSRLSLAAAVAALSTQADQASFTLTHSPEDGLPVVFDCFRGTVTRVSAFLTEKAQFIARLTVTMQALPFARNPVATTRSVVIGAGAGTQIDACDSLTVPGTVSAGVTLDTVSKVEGTASLKHSGSTVTVGRTFSTAQNFSTYAQLSFALMLFGTDESAFAGGTLILILTDTSGRTRSYYPTAGASRFNFVRTTVPLATGGGSGDLASIASYALTFFPNVADGGNTLWVDDVRGVPNATSTGRVLRVGAVQGTARTPVTTMTITAPSGTHKQVLIARWNDQPATFTPVIDAGTGVADTLASNGTAASGSGNPDLPIISANFRPGIFQVYALVRNNNAVAVTFTAQARVTTDNLAGGPLRYGSRVLTSPPVPVGTQYVLVFVGELELPALPVSPTNTAARTFLRLSGNVVIDEVYVIPTDADVAFLEGLNDTVVQLTADTGTINAFAGATTSTLTGASDRQVSQGSLVLRPGDNEILVVDNAQATGGPIAPTVTLTYHERWHFERAV